MNLPIIPEDKANHCIYGLGAFIVALLADRVFGLGFAFPQVFALFVAAAAGGLKEIWDARNGGDMSAGDFVSTLAGGFFGVLVYALV